jgi:hypothetical protein
MKNKNKRYRAFLKTLFFRHCELRGTKQEAIQNIDCKWIASPQAARNDVSGWLKIPCQLIAGILLCLTAATSLQAQNTYDITQVGTAKITSITSPDGTVSYYPGSALFPGGQLLMNFNMSITNPCALKPGDIVNIPVTTVANSHYAFNMSFNPDISYNGQTIFIVSTVGYSIQLQAQPGLTAIGCGSIAFAMQSICNTSPTTSMAALQSTTTTFMAGGNAATMNNPPYVFLPATGNFQSIYAPGGATGVVVTPMADFMGVWSNFLAGQPLSPADPCLSQDFVQVLTIHPNPDILSVNTASAYEYYKAYYLIPGTNQPSLAIALTLPPFGTPIKQQLTMGSLAAGATAYTPAQIQSLLQPGQKAIVENSDGSWTYAFNWGPLLNNPYLEYPDGTVITDDAPSNNALQQGIQAGLPVQEAGEGNVSVSFADPSATNAVTFDLASNNTSCMADITVPTASVPVNNVAAGQSTVKVHFINEAGHAVAPVAAQYGWGAVNTFGEQQTPDAQVAPLVMRHYQLITGGAMLSTAINNLTAQGTITSSQILTGAQTVPFPDNGAVTDVYYVYNMVVFANPNVATKAK